MLILIVILIYKLELIYGNNLTKTNITNIKLKNESSINQRTMIYPSGMEDSFDSIENEEPEMDTCDKERKMVLYFDFEKFMSNSKRVNDVSGCENHGTMDTEFMIPRERLSSCGKAIFLWNDDISVSLKTFQNKPKNELSVSMWLRLEGHKPSRGIFFILGEKFGNLGLEIDYDTIIWQFTDCEKNLIFRTQAIANVSKNDNKCQKGFFHLVATFNAEKGIAQIYINGLLLNRSISLMSTSFNFYDADIKIGGYEYEKPIDARLDEFKLFNYALQSSDVEFLKNSCQFSNCNKLSKRDRIEDDDDINRMDEQYDDAEDNINDLDD